MTTEFTLRIAAAVFCVILGIAGGRYKASRLSEREKKLEELISGITLFRNEIYYTHDRLEAVAERLSDSAAGCGARLFSHFAECLGTSAGKDSEMIWRDAVRKTFGSRSPLKENDLATLSSAGIRLGKDDPEGQCRYLEKTAAELEVRLREARLDKEARWRLYQTLGLAAGCAAAILVL